MKKDDVYILEGRGILYLNGEDVKEFLQNLITNNIEKVTNEMSCFAALLTPQGKYLFDFLIIKHKAGYFLDLLIHLHYLLLHQNRKRNYNTFCF